MNQEVTLARERILAIDPTPRGFGFVVLEVPNLLVDWGVTRVWSKSKRDFLSKVDVYINRYSPQLIVVEDLPPEQRRRRTRTLLTFVVGRARFLHTHAVMIPGEALRKTFESHGKTKRDRAVAIAEAFPELASRLPRVRRPWMSEDERMNIFDAMALALTAMALPKSELHERLL